MAKIRKEELAHQRRILEEKLKQAKADRNAARNARAARGRGPADKDMSDAAAVNHDAAAENAQIRAIENALKNLGL